MTESWKVEPVTGSGPQDLAAVRAGGAAAGAGDVEGCLPLSPLQSWLLFQSLDRPAQAAAVEQTTCLLAGELDRELLARAWQGMVDRHAALRCAFAWEEVERPVQLVRRRLDAAIEHQDWRPAAAPERARRLAETLAAERRRGFDLGLPPLVRLLVVRLDERLHRLIWTAHPLAAGGCPPALLTAETLELCRALAAGRPARLAPPLPWHEPGAREAQEEADGAGAETFWRGRLRGLAEPLPLPGERRGAEAGRGWREARLSVPATAALETFARRHGLTLDTLVQGAWALLLGRWSGREEALFGAAVPGASGVPAGHGLDAGAPAGVVPVRCPLPRDVELVSWLAGFETRLKEARPFAQTPLPRLQAWSELPPGAPLFEVFYSFQGFQGLDGPAGAAADAAIELRVPRLLPRADLPLALSVSHDGALALQLAFDLSRLSPLTAVRLLAQLEELLAGLPRGAGCKLDEISALSAAERQQLVHEGWSGGLAAGGGGATAAASAGTACLHERFAAQARRAPGRPAVSCEGRTLSYGELDLLAERLAARLSGLGAGPEVVVAVCLPRSLELVVALLAVLEAGAAYVPLDPGHPPQRLAWMLADSGARLLLGRSELADLAALAGGARLVPMDGLPPLDASGEAAAAEAPGAARPAALSAAPDNLAYIIYTSGSTGQPKGVAVTHANVARLLAVAAPRFGFGPDDVWTLFHSTAFDFSVWEMWGALALGGRLVVVPWAVSRSPESFAALLAEQRVTVLNQTPSAFAQLSSHLEAAPAGAAGEPREPWRPGRVLPALRWVIFGGEALEPALVRAWVGASGPRLVNMYGITETTVHVTWHELSPADLDGAGSSGGGARSPIGPPLPDLVIDLRDAGGQLVPLGVAGEMLVGGAGLARGYLGRPELTAERFVPDPWSGRRGAPGSRLYRSGDLARRLPGGGLDYLGRADSQVKVRGFRIEPGEIEAALLAEPGVAAAAVVVREPAPGDRRLAAYVTARGQEADGLAAAVRAALRQRLPDYMVPATVTALAALPLTANGKVDRRALAALDPEAVSPLPAGAAAGQHRDLHGVPGEAAAAGTGIAGAVAASVAASRDGAPETAAQAAARAAAASFVAPRTPAEEVLAEIWREVLRKPRVGVLDNFFDLGGDSILSLQVVSRAALAGWRITPRQLFDYPTVAGLAEVGEQVGAAAMTVAAAPLAAGEELPLTPVQRWFFAWCGSDRHHFNQAVMLRPLGPLPPAAARHAWQAVVAQHAALRLRFVPLAAAGAAPAAAGEGWRQVQGGAGAAAPFVHLDLSRLPAASARQAFTAAATALQAGCDLARGPLARAAWLQLPVADGVRALPGDAAGTPDRVRALPPAAAGAPAGDRSVPPAAAAAAAARLLIVIHHLAVDAVSWRVLAGDLDAACRAAAAGRPAELPPPTAAFGHWARRLAEQARVAAADPAELDWWRRQMEGPVASLPAGRRGGRNLAGSTRVAAAELDEDQTRALLEDLPAACRAQAQDGLLAALAAVLGGGQPLRVELEGHGREDLFPDLDLTRTVGWFTCLRPVRLALPAAGGPEAALQAVKEQRRAEPGRGLGWGLLAPAKGWHAPPAAEVSFNYLGQLDQALPEGALFALAAEPVGPMQSPRAERGHLLDVVAWVAGGRLHVEWQYGGELYDAATVEGWAAAHLAWLRRLLARCGELRASGECSYSPSDFPLARLSQADLDRLLGRRAGVEDLYPLTPLQHGLLFHSLAAQGSGAYVEQVLCTLRGELDTGALTAAWGEMVERHPVLRTSIVGLDLARPLQRVAAHAAAEVEEEDWRALDAATRERRIAERFAALWRDGLDLDRAPLALWSLWRTGETEHLLHWSYHHLLLDGWSFAELVAELAGVYEARRAGLAPRLRPRRPFRDFVAWLERRDLAPAESYWRRTLAGFAGPAPLWAGGVPPVDFAATAAAPRPEPLVELLPEPLSAALGAAAQGARLTLNTLVQGAWGVLLARYGGTSDVVFGVTLAGRPPELPGAESMLGLFINTLPLRLAVPGEAAPLPWLRRVQQAQAELREHEHTPLPQVQRWSEVPPGAPLFETLLVFENYPRDSGLLRLGTSLGLAEVRIGEHTHYPLALAVLPGDRLALRLDYDGGRWDQAAAGRLLAHLRNLLAGLAEALAAAAPAAETGGTAPAAARRLADLPWLSAEERGQLEHAMQGGAVVAPRPLAGFVAPRPPAGFVAPRTAPEELLAGIWREVLGKARVGALDDFFDLGGDSLLALQVVGRCRRAGLALSPQLVFAHPVLADLAAAAASRGGPEGEAAPAPPPAVRPPIGRVPRGQPLPPSFAQERLWFIDRLEPNRAAYNILLALRVRGAFSAAAGAAALGAVVRRHETLRTTFAEADGKPVQVIAPPAPPAATPGLAVVDLSALPVGRAGAAGAGEPEVLRVAAGLAARPFDLERGPLLRALLLRLTPAAAGAAGPAAEHVLLLALHHIVADAWSLAILMREIGELLGPNPPLRGRRPAPDLQYADFACWQRQWLAGAERDAELVFWRGLMADVPLRLALPTDRPRTAAGEAASAAAPAPSAAAGRHLQSLPADLMARLGELGRRCGATPFMVLLAAFQVLLHRLTGQERLVVGTAVANRPQPEVEGIVGLFVNTLPLPADLRDDPALPALLARVRDVALGAFAHQQLPFEQLVEALQPERSLEQTPVVQAMVVLQNATRPAMGAGGPAPAPVPGLDFEPLQVAGGAAKFELTLELVETPDGMAAAWEYPLRLLDAASVARWARSYGNLLAAMAAAAAPTTPGAGEAPAPGPHASELEMLSAAERHQLLAEWSGWTSRYPREAAIEELFAARAAAWPTAVALVAPATAEAAPVTVTYGELAARAARLAARLRGLGVASEELVAVCHERSPELIVALLAVLQAGGAYVPLDPQQPAARLAAMLDDLAAARPAASAGAGGRPGLLLLTSARHAARFTDFAAGGGRLVLDEEAPQAPAGPARSRPGRGGDRLAYVMFTSGSTGRPKGVAVTHRGVVRLVCGTGYAAFGRDEAWLQLAPPSFDASTLEIWAPLLHGGRLVLMPPGTPTLGELATVIRRQGVTSLWLTAGLFHQLVEEDVRALSPLRQVLAGGEALSPPRVRRFARELPATRLINGYGPTEGTTFTACWPVWAPAVAGAVPIGRPIANTHVAVLDAAGRPAPIGVAGELLIGGDGLARGYLGRPDLTADRFRPHPLAAHAGERVYHTGDLVRRLADGDLDFLGRRDRQVKIRGFRIEPAETEAALAALPGVAEAVVMTDRDGGELRLIGFVTAAGGAVGAGGGGSAAGLDPAALRAELRRRLPEAFVPAALWVVPAMPLTANGKLDREALLRLGPRAPRGDADGTPGAAADGLTVAATRDQLEDLVAGIWCGVLGIERVAAADSFFDLGGHSLRATQVISRLRQATGVDLPLRLLFEAPTVSGLAARLRAALADPEAAATAASAAGIGGPAGVGGGEAGYGGWTAIPRAPREVAEAPAELRGMPAWPPSFAQERLWFLDQLMPGTCNFNIPGVLLIDGPLDLAALAAAFTEIARRHESLRTVFRAPAGEPWQVVMPPARVPLPVVDLSALPEPDRAAAAARWQRAAANRGFDLSTGPVFRAAVLRLGAGADGVSQHHRLVLTFHHIAFDGWSVSLLGRELGALYEAALARRPSPLPELPLQYADFACWQRAWLSGPTLDRFAAYWRRRLTGVPPLRLPLDRPRPPLQSFSGGSLWLDFTPEMADGVLGLARRQAATPFMVGLAAFAALLARYSGQDDFAVGTWVANRNRPEIEDLIGFFINNLALRLDLGGPLTFERALAQVREAALGAFAHQDVPFEKLVEDLKLPRDLSLPPIFQAVAVQGVPPGRMALAGVELEPLSARPDRANVEVTLDLGDPANRPYTGLVIYNSDLFDRSTMERFGRHLERLLAAALADPAGAVTSELPLLAPAESWQLAGEWSRGLPQPAAAGAGAIGCVHQLIERWAALRPEAEAVVWPGDGSAAVAAGGGAAERLTYGELNARANRLARRLRRLGVGPEVRVALWLGRSADLAVCALATWKAGGCYVPLDGFYEGERLAFMAADSGARVLVTRGGLAGFTPPPGAAELRLDDPETAAAIAAESAADLAPAEVGLDPRHLAYVIYTSGSTGLPKGSMIEHRSLLAAFLAYEQAYRLDEVGAHLQMASFSFDVFTGDLVRALGSGARLVLCPRETLLDPGRLHGLMLAERIEGAELVPAVVRALVEHLQREGGSLDFMRLVVVSSDAWYAGEVAALARLCGPRTRLIDSYGVTEATIDTTFLALAAGDGTACLPLPPGAAVVPIGRPLAGNEAWVLGGGRELLPARLPGELCLGGAGVARGYLDRPALTAEKFVPHPFASQPGERLYRAGDLARWLADGSVEFLGRADGQIKVRGFRIEPGEIEAALGRHPQVRQAVVLAQGGEPGQQQLVAYVVAQGATPGGAGGTGGAAPGAAGGAAGAAPGGGQAPGEAELRAFLRQRLPDYMVPAVFVALAELPLTANGKVDRRALPAVDVRALAGADHQPPRTAAEELLAAIWREVLRIESVGVFDDFFAVGGHSLLATQVVSRVRAAFGVELPLRTMFEAPSLAEMALAIEEQLILQVGSLAGEEVALLP
jgi:amino acid adenylation domain-containing protein/non-ribosomal peptide synthase protein (TIGR01720 family)